jgi:hypothetical protein
MLRHYMLNAFVIFQIAGFFLGKAAFKNINDFWFNE